MQLNILIEADAGDSHTLTRVNEFWYNASETFRGCLKAPTRRVTNDGYLMGMINMHTLERLLQRRTEHAWVCPMSHDVNPEHK